MTEPNKKYITDVKGNKTAVILDLKDYEQLVDEIDELNCALGYDQAKKENEKDIIAGKLITLENLIAKSHNKKAKQRIKV
ncbi:MAG: hypothetical protein A2499_04235 [Stygiobacter sp. RIFOXYC12_FULL_38_8]|nr:MAG: hypothetical protein A2279_10470 [Stygiobacter sp. RIFOXYA12_FULL_38_9]OGV08275.1 MAG: hypothetical protein A2299_19170 [Stygiobacter sp. RIFOXYB2_FULL_37_11]OGV09921.1 MAG: hypothetical protein A2237_08580 [Stygiobacter sp. RIFOXYA2_FULL_38_8]OGV15242.1 MAG: hypothetical protein A2440_07315 [Stygiobacter sp. RIFOXYC2_FULL_38_25]OGV25122.1 MAG: hypothetical protein A2499_04235 [Stygiobacter sp. RIFOXYC12_FULL_38_8]OGV78980.1 MAG: hypothetical protein A2X65_07765 [Stygiobacter sp. GWF2_